MSSKKLPIPVIVSHGTTVDNTILNVTGPLININTALGINNLAGLQIERARGSAIQLVWNELAQCMQVGAVGAAQRVATVAAGSTGLLAWNGKQFTNATALANQSVSTTSTPVFAALALSTGVLRAGAVSYQLPLQDGAPGSTLVTNGAGQLSWSSRVPTRVVANSYTVLPADQFVVYAGTRPGTITLPDSRSNPGRALLVENVSNYRLSVVSLTDTIDGDSTDYTLDSRYTSSSLVSDGLGNWLII